MLAVQLSYFVSYIVPCIREWTRLMILVLVDFPSDYIHVYRSTLKGPFVFTGSLLYILVVESSNVCGDIKVDESLLVVSIAF